MSMPRKAEAASYLRRRAVELVSRGRRQIDAARLLDVSVRSVQRWLDVWDRRGDAGLSALADRSGCGGRPPKLDARQVRQVLSWLEHDPSEFGFLTEWWTAPRVAALIEQRLGVSMNKRYLNDWLGDHGVTPQVPEQSARERDQGLIDAWLRWQWPRIKKRPGTCTRRSDLPTNPASCWRR
jgi:transposase